MGGVQPVEALTVAERQALAVAEAGRRPGPRVLTDAELAALNDGRSMPSNTIRRGPDGAAGDTYSEAARRVNDWVRTGQDLDAAKLQELNRILLAGSEHASKGGVLRSQTGDWVGHGGSRPFYYAEPNRVPAYLDDFMTWYEANKSTLPPVELAAAAYQQLVRIHPFVDSNGRTTRLVMDFILQRNGYTPPVFTNVKAEAVHSTTADLAARVARGVADADTALVTPIVATPAPTTPATTRGITGGLRDQNP
jgi:prophage maintenance system killer protein